MNFRRSITKAVCACGREVSYDDCYDKGGARCGWTFDCTHCRTYACYWDVSYREACHLYNTAQVALADYVTRYGFALANRCQLI